MSPAIAYGDLGMDFRIADTFTDGLARLTGEEPKVAKTTAFDLQLNPVSPGMQFHRLTKSKDRNFWSVRVGSDLRLIVHKTASSLMLCYVDHHDAAYAWAERRNIERHPQAGPAQLVEVRETVREILVPTYVPKYVEAAPEKPRPRPLFADVPEWVFLSHGVPPEWMKDVRAATEDTLFERPDAQRRFRVIQNREELERALEEPWEKWTVFLHPAQRQLVERTVSGPVRVSGSAGTGKTVVALRPMRACRGRWLRSEPGGAKEIVVTSDRSREAGVPITPLRWSRRA